MYLRKVLERPGDTNPLKINDTIKIDNPRNNIFKYGNDYYNINDFMQIIVTNEQNVELIERDYSYVDFDNVADITDYEIVTVAKDISEVNCRIKRVYTDTHIEGYTVEKVIEDYDSNTFGYVYTLPNGGISPVQIGVISSNEWMSIDSKIVLVLKPIEKIKFLLTNGNKDCQNILEELRRIVFDKQ